MKRRVLLARALVAEPDLLLLDEPTNHLDIDAIDWLEDFLARWKATLIFVTHDRMFLRKLATRILEIDRGRLFDWSCDYDTFLGRKEAALAAEEKQNALFDKKLAEEEVWIRTGIKARRTRNEGRVRALEKLRRVRSERRETHRQGAARDSGRRAERHAGGRGRTTSRSPTASGRSSAISRRASCAATRSASSAPTARARRRSCGCCSGSLPPQAGTVRLGTNLQIAYFDQLRQQLDDEATVQENVGDGYDTVNVGGGRGTSSATCRTSCSAPSGPARRCKFLSGGERNRVLLAKLFAKPANVIVLDEPTNDLDAETLELLEERLVRVRRARCCSSATTARS